MEETTKGDAAVQDPAWDAQELTEIVEFIDIDWKGRLGYEKEKGNISGWCFFFNSADFCQPWRWVDAESQYKAVHVALSNEHVMYMVEKYSIHDLNPCPPCLCCLKEMWFDDFQPKVRKLIPFEKITDVEVQEAGSNELVPPGCFCPPTCNPTSVDVPISVTMINTAGSHGPELIIHGVQDASAFRRRVLGLKRTGPQSLAPRQQTMGSGGPEASVVGAGSEMVALLADIASSNHEIVKVLSAQQAGMTGSANGAPTQVAATIVEKAPAI